MTATVLSFFRRSAAPCDWSTQELAEFYRVESALVQAGMHIDSDRGMTDEGEPWFVFCRVEDDEVVIHFARIGGKYVISAPAYCGNASGYDFRALVRSMVERHPVLRLRPDETTLYVHPAALLIVLVASALLKSGEAAAAQAPGQGTAAEHAKWAATLATTAPLSEPEHEAMVLGAINAAIAVPVMVDTASVVAPAVEPTPHLTDLIDHSSLPSIESSLQDQWYHPLQADQSGTAIAGSTSLHSGGSVTAGAMVTQAVASDALQVMGSPADAHPHDSPSLSQGSSVADAYLAPSALTQATPPEVVGGSSEGGPQLPLSAFPNIAPNDLALLHALGVTSAVPAASGSSNAFPQTINNGPHVEATSPQVADHASAPTDAGPTDVGPSTPPATATAPAPPAAPALNVPEVMVAVQEFQAVEVQPVVLLTDHAAIFYDAHAVTTDLKDVQSITYDFQDGFSISLVGLPAELAHAVIHM